MGNLTSKVEKEIAFNDFCQFRSSGGDSFCENPAMSVCRYGGKVLDSNCSYTPGDNEVMISEEDVRQKFCLLEKKRDKDLNAKSKREKCKALSLTGEECRDYTIFLDQKEKDNSFNEKIFTDKKVEKLFKIGEAVKNEYLSMIERSQRLSDKQKKVMTAKIKRTRIHLNQDRFNNEELSDCYGSSNGNLSNGVFNQEDGYGGNEIHICSGLGINMDYMNPHALIHIIAHEFSHSIDPCALEVGRGREKYSAKDFYPKLVNCLRGTENGSCEGAELNCTEKGEVERYCKALYPSEWKECHKALSGAPSCVVGGHSHKEGYIHGVQEQINEGFSDFMASEVLGGILKNESPQVKADALLSIGSQISRRHDGCNRNPRKNSHPNAFIRLNKILMSSEKGRASFNCSGLEKKTCSGI
tara:strand:+ start:28807 stop:30045 length:1239 start_codon:yes stop_codon:yes gene_type:complete